MSDNCIHTENTKYVCDSDAIINLYIHFGNSANRTIWDLSKNNRLKLPEGVVKEIIKCSDELGKFMKDHREIFEVKIKSHHKLKDEIPRLEKLYGEEIRFNKLKYSGFWKSKAGRKSADSQVVALAKYMNCVVVTDDRAIKLVCALENVRCIGWAEFSRALGLIKSQQLFLNLGNDENMKH